MLHTFITNDFTAQYMLLIEDARVNIREIGEKHHIIPKSLGGADTKDNIVLLTYQEHLLAHKLLVDMTTGEDRVKMSFAYWMMVNVCNEHQQRIKVTSEEFAEAKIVRSSAGMTASGKIKIAKSRIGKIAIYNQELDKIKYVTEEEIEQYISLGYRKGGRPKTLDHREKIAKTNKERGIKPKSIGWNKGLTKETSPAVAKATQHMVGKPAWNKGKKDTGFGSPDRINPMKNSESIQKMLETRRKNKNDN